jgi:hypothetical protein
VGDVVSEARVGNAHHESRPAKLDTTHAWDYGDDVGNSPSDQGFAQKACTRPFGETKVSKKPQWN